MSGYKQLRRKEIYDGRVLHVVVDDVELPNGVETIRELVLHQGASAIIPIDENGDIILVEQFRYAVNQYTLEIPAGLLDEGEDYKTCAARELEEETGYKAEKIDFLFSIYPAIGFSNEITHIFVARNLTEGQQNLDEEEFVTVKKFSLDETMQMIKEGKIKDGKTISAIMAVSNLNYTQL